MIGLALATLFTLGNITGGVYAGVMGEMRHAGLHVILALVGAYVTWLIAARRRMAGGWLEAGTAAEGPPRELSSRLTRASSSRSTPSRWKWNELGNGGGA